MMVLNEDEKLEYQEHTLPAGYQLVTEGKIQEGDIRWNVWFDCWAITDPTQMPKHKLIVGDPINNFHGVCRKINK